MIKRIWKSTPLRSLNFHAWRLTHVVFPMRDRWSRWASITPICPHCHSQVESHLHFIEELPENSPRYVVLSYELKHKDGRTSFPLILINWSPSSSETGMMTLHASALLNFQNTVSLILCFSSLLMNPQADVSKVIEIRDGPEGLTKEVIDSKLLS